MHNHFPLKSSLLVLCWPCYTHHLKYEPRLWFSGTATAPEDQHWFSGCTASEISAFLYLTGPPLPLPKFKPESRSPSQDASVFRTNLLTQNFILFLNLVGPLALRIKVQDHGNWCMKLKNKPARETPLRPSQTPDTAVSPLNMRGGE